MHEQKTKGRSLAKKQTFLSGSELSAEDISAPTHRYHLLFLALLGQVFDAVDKELVGAHISPAGLNHPTAQLHQLMGGAKKHHFNAQTRTKST